MGETVLFVSLPSSLGGSTRSLATTLAGLDGCCRRVLATPRRSWLADEGAARNLSEEVVPIPGIEAPRWARLLAALRLIRWAARHRGQLAAVHANGFAELNIAAGAALVARSRLVVWAHDGALTPWARRLVPRLGRLRGATFVAVSATSARLLQEAGIHPRCICVVPNPIDPSEVVASRRPADGRVRVGYLGMPSELKGFSLLPEIARSLQGEPARILVFAGPPRGTSPIWAELEAIDDPEVEIRMRVTDVRQAYADCDIVLCPSRVESFGRVAAEAMLNGLPTVVADLSALREVVGDAGLVFPVGDALAAAEAVRQLVRSPELRAELGRLALSRSGSFAPGAIVAELAGIYGLSRPPISERRVHKR